MGNTERENSRKVYSQTLEAYYNGLLKKEKAGMISPEIHNALDTFIEELRTLVEESEFSTGRKAA